MARSQNKPIELKNPLDLVLADGSQVRIRPGPYGKGIAVIPLGGGKPTTSRGVAQPGQRGRRPRPGTVALREQLQRDAKSKRLKDNQHYVKWILDRDEGLSLAVARQIVYRERRRFDS